MIKQLTFFCLIVLTNLSALCQTVGQFKYKNKIYNVYPFRINSSEDILLVGYKIPDGDYVAFANYNFKEKFSFKKRRKSVLTDTTIVKGIFSIKNNLAEGSAVFYTYDISDNGKQSHTPSEEIKGTFTNGLKTGVWSQATFGKNPTEFTTYKNGIKDGYHWQSTYSGVIYSKDKFCDGDACDTVFYYRNGKVSTEYDITTNYYSNDLSSCYDKAIDLLNIRPNKVNTYYKQYENGVLKVNLNFKDGKALPFDSAGVKYENTYGDYYKYATIKKINDHLKVLTCIVASYYSKRFDQFYYQDDFMYQSKNINYRNVYKKKGIFKKRKIIRIDTTIRESIFINPESIIDSSIIPTLVYMDNSGDSKSEMYYIPKLKFLFEKNYPSNRFRRYSDHYYTFNKVDTLSRKVVLNETDFGNYHNYVKKSEYVFIHEDKEELNMFQLQGYLKKSYIINNELPNCYENHDRHTESLRGFNSSEYEYFPTKETYYKNDTLLNGIYYFSSARKAKHWPATINYTGYTGLENDICVGEMVKGKKEGLWKELNYITWPKRTPLDLKTYFFSHPKNVSGYNEVNFKEGMKHGNYIHYQMYNPKDDDSESKEPIVLYKEIDANYIHDTLHGNYKKYYPTGVLKQELNYIMGSPDGEYREYNETGDLISTIQFNKGKLNGKYLVYEDASMSCLANFKNNALSDSIVYYYNNHLPSEKVFAKNDTVIKKIKYFNNGKVKEEMMFNQLSTYTMSEELMLSQSFIETIIAGQYNTLRNVHGSFKNYYDNGQLLSEGKIKGGDLDGIWKFYSINGVLIHEVNFHDTIIQLPVNGDSTDISGFYTGYYSNGKKRCDGFIKELEVSYDCFTKQDKPDLDFFAVNFFDINGKQTLKNGNGYFVKYEANGLRVAAGKLVNCQEDSLWRYYTPEQKLDKIGNYVNNEKDGVWYEGDLEGINFEDGACFDMNNAEEVKAFNEKRKELNISKTIYRAGNVIDRQNFESNLNKEYKSRRRKHRSYTPSF